MKKIAILNGAAKKHGTTAAMLKAFTEAATENEIREFYLQTMNIHGCLDCGGCRRKEKKRRNTSHISCGLSEQPGIFPGG